MRDILSVARQLLELAQKTGIDYLFANLGSDHPAFIEAFAYLQKSGGGPKVIICPHEMTALSAAHGYTMLNHRAQMVLVHIDVGTANLGGSVHNVARSRVPVLIIAGLAPVTLNGELTGSRTEFIHFLQDTPHQDDIVRPYVKWSYELRAAESAESVFLRAFQIASMEPQGPVYITGAREIWDAPAVSRPGAFKRPQPVTLGPLPPEAVGRIAEALLDSKRPLVITSYLGRKPESVSDLVTLSERVGIGVLEAVPHAMNFPGNHPHHLGYTLGAHVSEADFILLLDVDVPWLPSQTQPVPAARVFHIDRDPLKTSLGHWNYPVDRAYQADTHLALQQLIDRVIPNTSQNSEARFQWLKSKARPFDIHSEATELNEVTIADALREIVDERTIIIMEAASSATAILERLRPERPEGFFGNGGTGLGWGINAAIGAKLANPSADVIAVVGDGAYVFGVANSTYWVAQTYGVAFLTIIINNGGWKSPKHSTQLVHADGNAARADQFFVTITSGSKLSQVAAASGNALSYRVAHPQELRSALRSGLAAIRRGQCAVIEAFVAPVSTQQLS